MIQREVRRGTGGACADGLRSLWAAGERLGLAPHLPVHSDRLRLDAGDGAEDEDGAVEHTQRTLNLRAEKERSAVVGSHAQRPAAVGGTQSCLARRCAPRS